MADTLRRDIWLLQAVYLAIAVVIFFLRLLPVGSAPDVWPMPDILLCLTLAWVTRRPDQLPVLLVVAIYLVEDLLLMRPPGLWCAMVVLGTEFLRGRAALTRELGFAMEWLMVSAVMVVMLLANRAILGIAFLPQPSFAQAVVQTLGTILCYPVIVGLSQILLHLRKPATGEVDEMGRPL